jgi:DNA-binding response OmpR family regulator
MTKLALILNGSDLGFAPSPLRLALDGCGYLVDSIQASEAGDFSSWEKIGLVALHSIIQPEQIESLIRMIRGSSDARILYCGDLSQEEPIVAALHAGADQLLPVGTTERVAAQIIRALERRERVAPDDSVVHAGPLEIDVQGYQVRANGERILLTLTEFRILAILAKNSTRAVDRDELRSSLSSKDYVMATRMIDYHVLGLRRHLGHYGALVRTIRGVGYQLRTA